MNFDIDLDENKEIKKKKNKKHGEKEFILQFYYFFNSLPSKHQLQPLNLLITLKSTLIIYIYMLDRLCT